MVPDRHSKTGHVPFPCFCLPADGSGTWRCNPCDACQGNKRHSPGIGAISANAKQNSCKSGTSEDRSRREHIENSCKKRIPILHCYSYHNNDAYGQRAHTRRSEQQPASDGLIVRPLRWHCIRLMWRGVHPLPSWYSPVRYQAYSSDAGPFTPCDLVCSIESVISPGVQLAPTAPGPAEFSSGSVRPERQQRTSWTSGVTGITVVRGANGYSANSVGFS